MREEVLKCHAAHPEWGGDAGRIAWELQFVAPTVVDYILDGSDDVP